MQRVPIAKYLKESAKVKNVHSSDITSATVTSGIFKPASAHHRFNKYSTQVRKAYSSVFETAKVKDTFLMPPTAITCGAERVTAFESMEPQDSLTHNVPYRVWQQRLENLDRVSSTCNSRHKRAETAPSGDYATTSKPQYSTTQFTSNKQVESILNSTGFFKQTKDPLHMTRQLNMHKRPAMKILHVEPEVEEDDNAGAFIATPADDIPRNKLTEKLTRGIQSFVQRM